MLLLIAFLLIPAQGYFDLAGPSNQRKEMNGIRFEQYKDFPQKWKLVTVRFRQDSGEIRMTYANEKAIAAMNSLKPDYPDGAVFAKIGFTTEEDPAFPSSKVPSGAKRYQFMVRDKKKYKDTDGWGYALFDANGVLFPEDVTLKTKACAACHSLVPERDYVFSRMMALKVGAPSLIEDPSIQRARLNFAEVSRKEIPNEMKEHIKKYETVSSLQGPLQKNAFSGTLDEIIPVLIEKSKMTQTPTALIVNEKNFSLIVPIQDSEKCKSNSKNLSYQAIVQFNGKKVRDATVCD